jgi:nitric oxide reductase NorE protein
VSLAAERHVPGEAGLWVLIFGDLTVFAVLFCRYLLDRGQQPAVFVHAQETLNRDLGAVNTVVLLTSSLLVVLATHGRAMHRRAPALLAAAIALGLVFVGLKVWEYHHLLADGITPQTDSFYAYYFALTGLHLAHLIVGLVVLTALTVLARRRSLTDGQQAFVEGGACFWHMVDLLWLVIFPLLFLVR